MRPLGGFPNCTECDNGDGRVRRIVSSIDHIQGKSNFQALGVFRSDSLSSDFFPSPLQMEKLFMLRTILGCALALAMVTSFATAADTDSECLKAGESIGAFYVTKVAGAEGDGVEEGQDLCYRCLYGSRPMVMIFARNTGGQVPQLIKQLDSAIEANESTQLRSFVTLIGKDAAALKQAGKKIAEQTGAKKVPFTVAKETESGPASYRIPADTDVTIVVANDSKVVGTHSFAVDQIDIAALVKQVKEMLN